MFLVLNCDSNVGLMFMVVFFCFVVWDFRFLHTETNENMLF